MCGIIDTIVGKSGIYTCTCEDIRKGEIMKYSIKNVGIIADREAEPNFNNGLRWMMDTLRTMYYHVEGSTQEGKDERFAHVSLLQRGLEKCYGMLVEYDVDYSVRFYRNGRHYYE